MSNLFIDVLEFGVCYKIICVNVPIVDDEIVENDESLELTLERPPGLDSNIILSPADGIVQITEDDGKYGDHMVAEEVMCSNTHTQSCILVNFMNDTRPHYRFLCHLQFVKGSTSPPN